MTLFATFFFEHLSSLSPLCICFIIFLLLQLQNPAGEEHCEDESVILS